MRIRKLLPTEEAFTVMNEHHPLCAVIVLHVAGKFQHDQVVSAVRALEKEFTFLTIGIEKAVGRWYFIEKSPPLQCPVNTHERKDGSTWETVVEEKLNTRIDPAGPLLHVEHVSKDTMEDAEVVLAFHHSLVDSIILRILLDSFLASLGGVGHTPVVSNKYVPPGKYPFALRGWRLTRRMLQFGIEQAADEMQYQRRGAKLPVPGTSENAVCHVRFSEDETRRLKLVAAGLGLNLNSLLNAAMLLAVVKHKFHDERKVLYRTMTFADIRPFLIPTQPPETFGCFIAMLRYTLPITKDDNLVSLARKLQVKITASGRKGEIFLFHTMTARVAKMSLMLRNTRMANSALSFIGQLDLRREYEAVRLRDVSAYITNNALGPEFTGFGKILHGRIGLDCCYLTAETTQREAQAMLDEVRNQVFGIIT